jgi:hypothetical protein
MAAPLLAVPNAAFFNAGVNGTVVLSGSPYTTLTTFRVEGRETAWTMPASLGARTSLWSAGGLTIAIVNNSSIGLPELWLLDFSSDVTGNNPLKCTLINPVNSANRADFVWRLTKDTANRLMTLEVWNVDASGYTVSQSTLTSYQTGVAGTLQIGDGSLSSGSIAFIRWFSTILPIGSKAPFGGPAGDLGDYEFNNNGRDSSTHGNNLSYTSSPSYAAAPIYSPACILPAQTTFRAGYPVTGLTAANSFPLNGTNSLTGYLWQQVPGNITTAPPSLVNWNDSQTSINPTVSELVFGSYTIQLTVTDSSGQASTCSQKYGVVATDSNGSVIIPNPVHAQILGPIIQASVNPWPLYELDGTNFAGLMIAKLQNQAGNYPSPFVDYWNTPQPGTITVTTGSAAVVGVGTSFTTTFCQGPGNPNVPKNVAGSAPYLVPWYPISTALYPTQNYGRLLLRVASCTDDTHLTVTNAYAIDAAVQAGTGLSYAYCDDGNTQAFGGIGAWETGSYPGNYYDNVEAFYAQYYRTGIDDYLYWARTMADRWFSYPGIDKGAPYFDCCAQQRLANRSLSMTGIFMRNADNPPFDYSPGIRSMINYLIYNETTGSGCNASTNCPVGDLRENGHALLAIAMDALYDSSPTQAATDLATLSTIMSHKWVPGQQPHGEWVMNDVLTNSYASWGSGFTATVSNGFSTVTPASGSTFNCSNFTAAPFSAANYPSAIWFTSTGTTTPTSNAQGESAWYYVQCNSGGGSLTLLSTSNGSTWSSTNYTGNLSSGVGWEVGGLLGYGNQPFMNGILNRGFYFTNLALASSDPTNAANAAAFTLSNALWMINYGVNMTQQGGFTTDGLYYGRDFVTCEPMTAQYPFCDSGLDADRLLNGEGLNVVTTAYLLHPDIPVLKTFGDVLMSAMFSCTTGSIDYTGYCTQSDFSPAGGYLYGATTQHKWWGYYWGVGGNWSWASARQGGLLPPAPRVIQQSLNFQNATQAVVTVTHPDSTSSQTTCTSSPCALTVDAREGDHLFSVQYLDSSNHLLRSQAQTPIRLQ